MSEDTNISLLFFEMARLYRDRMAIIDREKKITYKNLAQEIYGAADYFREKGIQPGDRVFVFIPMSLQLYKTVLALFYIGAVAVFLDAWVNKKRMEACCAIAECKGFIAPFTIRLLALFSAEIRGIPIKLNPSKNNHAKPHMPFVSKADDPALITFTTGSTGTPKAAGRTHGFLKAQFTALEPLLSASSQIDMTLLPIVLFLNLGTGKTSVIADFKASKAETFNPAIIYNQLQKEQVASITFSPYFLIALSDYLAQNKLTLPHIKSILSGGGPVFPDDVKRIKKAFPDARFTIVYGSTEAEPITHCDAREFLARYEQTSISNGLFVGTADNTTRIKIIPISAEPVTEIIPLRADEIGEIIVSGPQVLTTYWNNPSAVRQNKIHSEGKVWHRTGDAGFLDKNNRLFLLGRCRQIIYWQEKPFYPFLIEDMVKHIPGIVCGTLILNGTSPLLVIQRDLKYTEDIVRASLKNLALPEFAVFFIHRMPMDKRHHTKIDYEALSREVVIPAPL